MIDLHSPQDFAAFSTLVHNLAGWLLLVVAGAMLAEALGRPPQRLWRYLWPSVAAFIGFGLFGYLFFHLWLYHRISPLSDPVLLWYQALGLVPGLGAGIELLGRRRGSIGVLWKAAWPLSLLALGCLFLVDDEQGSPAARLRHGILAATLVLVGLALLLGVRHAETSRRFRLLGILLLVTAAVQLVVFRDAPGERSDPRAMSSNWTHVSPQGRPFNRWD